MKKSMKLITAVAAVFLLAQPSLFAERGGHMSDDGRGHEKRCMKERGGPLFGDPGRMQKDLGLTDAQMKRIAEINRDHEKKMLDYREKLAPKEIHLERLLLEDSVDMDKVRALLREISDLRMELQLRRIHPRLEIEKVLTPEQKSKMKQHRKHRMMKPGGPGPGM